MEPSSDHLSDAEYAKIGLALWFNNKPEEAEEFFKQRLDSTPIFAAYIFVVCMNSIIAYDVERIEKAQNLLKELEKKCSLNYGWLNSIRTKWFSRATPNRSLATTIEEQIISADAYMNQAILTFFTQDISGLLKGSWLLSKAWKIYQSTYSQIYSKYVELFDNEMPKPPQPHNYHPIITRTISQYVCTANVQNNYVLDSSPQINSSNHHVTKIDEALNCDQSNRANIFSTQLDDNIRNFSSNSFNIPGHSRKTDKNALRLDLRSDQNGFIYQGPLTCPERITRSDSNMSFNLPHTSLEHIEPDEVKRLMGSIAFGYGIFQLSASLLPNHLLKIINFFGFESNRTVGISSLMYSRMSTDIRSTLASVALLWFYTFGSQMFKNEDGYSDSDIKAASLILGECKSKFPNSAIFLFFQGRVERMKANTSNAIGSYNSAFQCAAQKELKLLCLQEVAWCRMIQLDFSDSAYRFNELRQICSFSKAFYAYLTAVCQGAHGNYVNLISFRTEIYQLTRSSARKDTQIIKFLHNRIKVFPSDDKDHHNPFYWKYLVYEVLYLWNALGNVSYDQLEQVVDDCSAPNEIAEGPMIGLKKLILGSALTSQRRFQAAVLAFKDCIKECQSKADYQHITVFAHYELAMLLMQCSKDYKDDAKKLLQDALSYKNYDLENRLIVTIQKEQKKLN
ncbi:tetratricopeptide repeat protein 39C-like isoform X2 [Bradysia coprophila]|uniref:tetratricopeptide repeat protein 39C-like isoform X2 n=1 Tax=Bradysia coprophila TaxID=38358 RepID=UPI00187D9B13|nr:tetratricopeptide repeat protein 39C-like isoform X2 [Bradysia coprophila]